MHVLATTWLHKKVQNNCFGYYRPQGDGYKQLMLLEKAQKLKALDLAGYWTTNKADFMQNNIDCQTVHKN